MSSRNKIDLLIEYFKKEPEVLLDGKLLEIYYRSANLSISSHFRLIGKINEKISEEFEQQLMDQVTNFMNIDKKSRKYMYQYLLTSNFLKFNNKFVNKLFDDLINHKIEEDLVIIFDIINSRMDPLIVEECYSKDLIKTIGEISFYFKKEKKFNEYTSIKKLINRYEFSDFDSLQQIIYSGKHKENVVFPTILRKIFEKYEKEVNRLIVELKVPDEFTVNRMPNGGYVDFWGLKYENLNTDLLSKDKKYIKIIKLIEQRNLELRQGLDEFKFNIESVKNIINKDIKNYQEGLNIHKTIYILLNYKIKLNKVNLSTSFFENLFMVTKNYFPIEFLPYYFDLIHIYLWKDGSSYNIKNFPAFNIHHLNEKEQKNFNTIFNVIKLCKRLHEFDGNTIIKKDFMGVEYIECDLEKEIKDALQNSERIYKLVADHIPQEPSNVWTYSVSDFYEGYNEQVQFSNAELLFTKIYYFNRLFDKERSKRHYLRVNKDTIELINGIEEKLNEVNSFKL